MGRESSRQKRARNAAEARHAQADRRVSEEEIKKNIEKLKRKKGQFITKDETACMLACYFRFLLDEGFNHNRAVKKAAEHLPFPETSVRKAVLSWNRYGEIRVASRSGPTGGGLTADVRRYIVRCINKLNSEGDVTLSKLQAMLRIPPSASGGAGGDGGPGGGASGEDSDNGRKPISVCRSTIRNWLQIMGYSRVKGERGVIFNAEEAAT